MTFKNGSDNNFSGDIPLRDAHPQLFKGMVLKVVILFLIGMILLFRPDYVIENTLLTMPRLIPLAVWGVVFSLIAVMLGYGISNGGRRYKWARRALIIGAVLAGIWAVAYVFALFGGISDRPFAALFWLYVCGNFIIWTGEPAFNPLSSALHSRGTTAGEFPDAR